MIEHFHGVDFANQRNAFGSCYLSDDGTNLTVRATKATFDVLMLTAVDCPLGTTVGMLAALRGLSIADACGDGFKSRRTEEWLRNLVGNYQTFQVWDERPPSDRTAKEYHFFNAGGHLQPALGMKIVPECLRWVADRFAPTAKASDRRRCLQQARLGNASVVEAHPRTYLYSAIERLHRQTPLSSQMLRRVRDYTKLPNRNFIREFLVDNPAWLGPTGANRTWQFEFDVTASAHLFDAWLCAMTAWSHRQGETITWQSAGLDESIVKIEGHILVLRQPPPAYSPGTTHV